MKTTICSSLSILALSCAPSFGVTGFAVSGVGDVSPAGAVANSSAGPFTTVTTFQMTNANVSQGHPSGTFQASDRVNLDLNFDGLTTTNTAGLQGINAWQGESGGFAGRGRFNIITTQAYSAGDRLTFSWSMPTQPFMTVSNADPYMSFTTSPTGGAEIGGEFRSAFNLAGVAGSYDNTTVTADLFGLNVDQLGSAELYETRTGAGDSFNPLTVVPNGAGQGTITVPSTRLGDNSFHSHPIG